MKKNKPLHSKNDYIVRCLLCNKSRDLQMVAHRTDGKVSGFVFSCLEHYDEIAGANISFVPEKEK